MVRRKGERRIVKQPLLWTEDGIIARAIRSGDRWLYAWQMQQCVSMEKLRKVTGIPAERLEAIYRGAEVTEGELEVLAVALGTDSVSLRHSIAYSCRGVR